MTQMNLTEAVSLLESFQSFESFVNTRLCQIVKEVPYTSNKFRSDENSGCSDCGLFSPAHMSFDESRFYKIDKTVDYCVCGHFADWRGDDTFSIELNLSQVMLPDAEWEAFVSSERDRVLAGIASRDAAKQEARTKELLNRVVADAAKLGFDLVPTNPPKSEA